MDIIWTAEQVRPNVVFQMIWRDSKNTEFSWYMWMYIKYDAHYSGIRVTEHMMY